MNVVSDKRRAAARKHATKVRTCECGKRCRGNGGWSSHRRACERARAEMHVAADSVKTSPT